MLGRQYEKHCEILSRTGDRFSEIATMMTQWVKLHSEDKSISEYFKKNGFENVAVYGLSDIGYTLINELEKNDIRVAYCIDRNADNIFSKIEVYRPDSDLQKTDCVVVAVVQYYDEIKEMLEMKMDCPIISLADLVWEI